MGSGYRTGKTPQQAGTFKAQNAEARDLTGFFVGLMALGDPEGLEAIKGVGDKLKSEEEQREFGGSVQVCFCLSETLKGISLVSVLAALGAFASLPRDCSALAAGAHLARWKSTGL